MAWAYSRIDEERDAIIGGVESLDGRSGPPLALMPRHGVERTAAISAKTIPPSEAAGGRFPHEPHLRVPSIAPAYSQPIPTPKLSASSSGSIIMSYSVLGVRVICVSPVDWFFVPIIPCGSVKYKCRPSTGPLPIFRLWTELI